MKIVHIEEFFHPSAGYQINLISKYMAKFGNDVTIISCEKKHIPKRFLSFFDTSNILMEDKLFSKKYGVNIIRMPVYGYLNRYNLLKFGFLKYLETLRYIKTLKPDILFVHGNHPGISMVALLYYKRMNIPYILDSHMLEMASEGDRLRVIFRKLYRMIFTPIIIKNNLTVIRAQNDNYVKKCLGIPLEQAPWISVGSDIMLFKPDIDKRNKFRKEHGIADDDFVIIYAGKIDENKGGMLLGKTFFDKIENVMNKNIVILIVGSFGEDEYSNKVLSIIEKSQNRIIRFPTQKYESLAKFYQASDLSVFPKQCSLSFYDAQACGLPVIAEDNNINVDRLRYNNGFTFKSGDVNDFRSKILQCINMGDMHFTKMKNNAVHYVVTNYNYEEITKRYLEEMQKSISRFYKE